MSKQIQESKDQLIIQAAVISHIGCVRTNNEDNFYFDGDLMAPDEVNTGTMFRAVVEREYHVLGICDGMGGLESGEKAAYTGVSRMKMLDYASSVQEIALKIDEYAIQASEEIRNDAKKRGEGIKEGTTMVLVYMTGGTMHVANVGDSRVYVLRNMNLVQVSMDQSALFQRMLAGQLTREQLRKHPESNKIEHYLGMPEDRIGKDFVFHRNVSLCSGDRLFICSDGISDLLSHEAMEKVLCNNASPMDAAKQLVEMALELGGKDNATLIVADVTGTHLPMVTPASVAALNLIHENTATINTTQS